MRHDRPERLSSSDSERPGATGVRVYGRARPGGGHSYGSAWAAFAEYEHSREPLDFVPERTRRDRGSTRIRHAASHRLVVLVAGAQGGGNGGTANGGTR